MCKINVPQFFIQEKCLGTMISHIFDVGTKLKTFSTKLSHLYFFTDKTHTGRVSVQGVESLWGDCGFIPADWGS